ncbi:hypothetical protein E2C01_007271 [Portunus trituberculatus]|uniref:Uncharacterized protein n=1 Tax=Portunus trituberculatus TaxID=210409 RepID=A0A5B7D3W9_PORTR|nr:hypothetical protein [Portunus trituberculatus]
MRAGEVSQASSTVRVQSSSTRLSRRFALFRKVSPESLLGLLLYFPYVLNAKVELRLCTTTCTTFCVRILVRRPSSRRSSGLSDRDIRTTLGLCLSLTVYRCCNKSDGRGVVKTSLLRGGLGSLWRSPGKEEEEEEDEEQGKLLLHCTPPPHTTPQHSSHRLPHSRAESYHRLIKQENSEARVSLPPSLRHL